MANTVSVIIPTYNMGKYLSKAISSVMSQTQGGLELIIVDDGSTDDTPNVVRRIAEQNVREDLSLRYVRKENGGKSSAINDGMKLVSAPKVTILDADDDLPADSLELRCRKLDEDTSQDGVFGTTNVFDEKGQFKFKMTVPSEVSREELTDLILEKPSIPIHICSLMLRTDKARLLGGFDEEYKRSQDIEFALRSLGKLNIGFLSEPVYNYHLDGHNLKTRIKNRLRAIPYKVALTFRYSSGVKRLTRSVKRLLYECAKLGVDCVANTKINPLEMIIYVRHALGKEGKTIDVYKIRTMVPDADNIRDELVGTNGLDEQGKVKDDPRVTYLGAILRKYWIDEIPQLFHLARGDLALVGIRPRSKNLWKDLPTEHRDRALQYKPGLIGVSYAKCSLEKDGSVFQLETDYLDQKERNPFLTDVKYLLLVGYNILFRGCRSS